MSIYVKPGEIYFSISPETIMSVLGSCVCVCLYDPGSMAGGINHYALPYKGDSEEENLFRYGDYAIPKLIDTFLEKGAKKKSLVAQVVGGANMGGDLLEVGRQNIEMAQKILCENEIAVEREDVGGEHGRVIKFATITNQLSIRKIGSTSATRTKTQKLIQLTSIHPEFIQEILSPGVFRAAKAINQKLDFQASAELFEVSIRSTSYVQQYLKSKFSNFLISTKSNNKEILGTAVLMVGKNSMEVSALKEITSTLIFSILNTLAKYLSISISLLSPKLTLTEEELKQHPFVNVQGEDKANLAIKGKIHFSKENSLAFLLIQELNAPCFI